jgi:VanZ family protein
MPNIRLLLFFILLLVFLSLNPWLRPDSHKAIGMISWDLLDHAGAYGLVTILLLRALEASARQPMATLLAVALSSALGVALEFAQLWLTSSRTFSPADAYANIFGSAMAGVAYAVIRLGIRLHSREKL